MIPGKMKIPSCIKQRSWYISTTSGILRTDLITQVQVDPSIDPMLDEDPIMYKTEILVYLHNQWDHQDRSNYTGVG